MRSLPTGPESQDPFRGSAGMPNDSKEFLWVKTGAAHQEAVDVRLGEKTGRVLRRRRAAVEDRQGRGGAFHQLAQQEPQEGVDLLRRFRRRRLARADGPYRLVGQGEGAGGTRDGGDSRSELPLQHAEGAAFPALV